MNHNFPRKPVRPGGRFDFERQLREAVIRNRPIAPAGVRAMATTQGVCFDGLPDSAPPTTDETIIGVQRFRIVDVLADALLCEEWDGTTVGNRVFVAKPYHLRYTPFHRDEAPGEDEEGFGEAWYEYSSDTNGRTVHRPDGMNYEELLEPIYTKASGSTPGDEIIGIQVTGGTGVDTIPGLGDLEWEDANVDARHWDVPLKAFGICLGGAPRVALLRGDGPF